MKSLRDVITAGTEAWARLVQSGWVPQKARGPDTVQKIIDGRKKRDYIVVLRGPHAGVYYLHEGKVPGEIIPYIPTMLGLMREYDYTYDAQEFLFHPRTREFRANGTLVEDDPNGPRPFEPIAHPVTQAQWEYMHGLVIVGHAVKLKDEKA